MALKDNWIDRQNGIDDVDSEDINKVARAVIEAEKRLDNDVSELKGDLVKLANFNIAFPIIKNAYIALDGTIVDNYSGEWDRTDFIKCDDYDSLVIHTSVASSYNAFYDADKNFINRVDLVVGVNNISVPVNAMYIALSNTRTGMDTVSIEWSVKRDIENLSASIKEFNYSVEITKTWAEYSIKKGNYYEITNNSELAACAVFSTNEYGSTTDVQTLHDGILPGETQRVLANSDASYIRVYFNKSGSNKVIIKDCSKIIPKIEDRLCALENNTSNSSIMELNRDKLTAIKASVSAPIYSYSVQDYSQKKPWMPMILFITDEHDDFVAVERALDFADECDQVVCTISLGDFTNDSVTDADAIDIFTGHRKPVYRILGNHEILYNTGTLVNLHDRYFNDTIVQHNGESKVQNELYWYKDIVLENVPNKKLRILGLCHFDFDKTIQNSTSKLDGIATYSNEQLEWMCNRLEECDENTYVVALSHFPMTPYDVENPYNKYFTPNRNYFNNDYSTDWGNEVVAKIIDAWMYGKTVSTQNGSSVFTHTFNGNRENNFMCWVSGHEHRDSAYTMINYPKQLDINLDTTCSFPSQCGFGDIPRRQDDKSRDSITLISFDWFNHGLNLIRLGSDVTKDMRDRKYTHIDLP